MIHVLVIRGYGRLKRFNISFARISYLCGKSLFCLALFPFTESPTYQELKSSKPASFKIGGSDCTFTKEGDDCPIKYKAKGTCNLHTVASQLFPDVNLEESTNKFIVPAKFDVNRLEMFACQSNPKDGMVSFVAKSVESVELAPQKLTLGAETRLRISWDTEKKFDPEKLEVKLKGFTSIGKFSLRFLKSFAFINRVAFGCFLPFEISSFTNSISGSIQFLTIFLHWVVVILH